MPPLATSGPSPGQKPADQTDLATIAQQVLQDPNLLENLVEQVYQLLRRDLQTAQERVSGYGHRRN